MKKDRSDRVDNINQIMLPAKSKFIADLFVELIVLQP
jgi:hypothetical protein